MLCGTNGAVAAMDRAYMSLRARKPGVNKTSEQSSPFRRWTTGSGGGSSYRHHDHRNMYNKQISEGSAPAPTSANSSNVARWSLGLEQLLADPAGAAAFAHFLNKEFAAENIRFWWSCEKYKSLDTSQRAALAAEIWQRHLAEGACEPVNVDATARRAAMLLMCQDPPPQDLFLQAQKQIFNVMKFDSYPRFLRSGVHAECARADLRGLPPPYCAPEHETTPSKLKKSASNASERRRSGGASLLPWRLRPASRDRAQPTNNTDVVKSTTVGTGLCRVVLPDGATSVVGVGSGGNSPGPTTVGSLVDKLLARRNLVCPTYDVVLRNPEQDEPAVIDVQCPASTLSGREVSVERRAVVRLELSTGGGGGGGVGTRCVAVRCGGARPLRHVARRVALRYDLPAHTVLRNGVPVHPDTLMQDLDGCRLQIVELCEGGGATGAESNCARAGVDSRADSDADSLTELALRLHDDRDIDTQSNSTTSSGTSRVRAALRPGPPLHHHPPDFLDNLRETQRQRLHKDESPRAPPPLPPKPTHRPPPTLV